MVFAVRCPSAPCRKYFLAEESDRGKTVACLLCKAPVVVPGPGGVAPPASALLPKPAPAVPARPAPSSKVLPRPAPSPASLEATGPYAPFDLGPPSGPLAAGPASKTNPSSAIQRIPSAAPPMPGPLSGLGLSPASVGPDSDPEFVLTPDDSDPVAPPLPVARLLPAPPAAPGGIPVARRLPNPPK